MKVYLQQKVYFFKLNIYFSLKKKFFFLPLALIQQDFQTARNGYDEINNLNEKQTEYLN
jgi:hypothetical protein